jgi:uncharacterized damage-inducible protein DinB
MKRVTVLLGMMFVLATATSTFAQAPQGAAGAPAAGQGRGDGQGRQGGGGGGRGRGPAAPACTTLACDLQADWTRSAENFYNLVNAMPEDKFGFKPTPAQQSFAERVMHVATIDLNLFGALGGKTPAPAINGKASTKADVLAALTQWRAYGDATIKEFNDQQLLERVMPPGFMGPSASRARLIAFELQHTQDIYGQLVVYVRLNGVTPPASNRGGV